MMRWPDPGRRILTAALGAVLLALLPTLTMAQPGAIPDTMAQRMQACVVCHGREGRATPDGYQPRIAGKPAGYLVEQLRHFRDGRRRHAIMADLLAHMSDDYLDEIAAYFAALDLPYPAPPRSEATAAQLARGQALVRQGDPARGLPACVECHGQAMTGIAPFVPGLLGLPRDYLLGQFGAWREGLRQARAPDCMAQISQRLSPQDVSALAAWLASQPVPPGPVPVRDEAAAAQASMACGSMAPVSGAVPGAVPAQGDAGPPQAALNSAPGRPGAARPSAPAQIPKAVDAQVARGAYLARAGNCAACHTAPGGAPYAGGRSIQTPFGTVYAGNLTPDEETGLGRWTAAEFRRALHEGRSRDGRLLAPAFPYPNYTLVTPKDADALFAFLRSLPPVRQANRAHTLRFPYGTQPALAAWRALYFRPGTFEPDTQRSAQWNRGAYLVRGLGHCAACHAPRNPLGATSDPLALAGGVIPRQNWYAPSLVAADEAAVIDWPEDDIVALLRDGVSPHGAALGPMAEVVYGSTQHLDETDLRAMAAYLRALPPVPAARADVAPAPAAVREAGARLYEQHCAACHGEQGQGAGPYAALAGHRTVTMHPATNLLRVIMVGGFPPTTAGNPRPYGMPPFGQTLNDTEIAALATYLRSSWGHTAAPVEPLEVLRLR